jgi:hypothetical protein
MNEEIKALAKIKVLIKRYYEDLGRDEFTDEETSIEDIEEILNKVKIPSKYLIVEDLEKLGGEEEWEQEE